MFSHVKLGLDNYFRSIGVTDAVTHYYEYDDEKRKGKEDVADWAEMKRRLDIGDPFIYSVSEHYYYNNHAVLAVGYLQYNYQRQQATGLYAGRYLLVVDGNNVHANRYINVDVGHNSRCDEMVTLYFVYSNGHK